MSRIAIVICFVLGLAGTAYADAVLDAYNKGDYAEAFRLTKDLAEQGDATAQYNLGAYYAQGMGGRKG